MTPISIQNKILWLASYPKSGNTWFRAFLTALYNNGRLDINDMETAGILSSRQLFEQVTDLDSYYLHDKEVKNMIPDVFRAFAQKNKKLSIIKVHDAYSHNSNGMPIIPHDVTHCAVYIIRNPLDVVSSLANHLNNSIDVTIKMMNAANAYMGRNPKYHNNSMQLSQLLYSWSNHVLSWKDGPDFPVYIVRYEDMHQQPLETFSNIVRLIGLKYSDNAIMQAIESSSFNKLKEQEQNKGFKESPYKENHFFRKGQIGSWEKELSEEQAKKITEAHATVMKQFNYL